MNRFVLVVLLVVAAFAVGYVPMKLELVESNQQLAATRESLGAQLAGAKQQLRLSALQGELGMLVVEVEQANFGKARVRSSRFFDGLRDAIEGVEDQNTKRYLAAVLMRRDQVTSDLVLSNPETAPKLRDLYVEFLQALGMEPKTLEAEAGRRPPRP